MGQVQEGDNFPMSTCAAKHTFYQPTDEEWRCPKCGATNDGFVIDESDPDVLETCGLLHSADMLRCFYCDWSGSGRTFVNKLAKEKNLVVCPTCEGTGHVSKKNLPAGKED